MIDFTAIPQSGEVWELFARDFLNEIGFYIESTIDRGPDGKKDLIVSEHLKGNLGQYKFKWLVSCKHFATSGRSVREEDEINISERIDSFNCDGFIGFYSTVPSSGLNTRLNQLKANGKIKDYRVFDYKLIENYLITIGYSELLMRYFPISYKTIKPLHIIFDKYYPLECKVCHADLLKKVYEQQYNGIVAFVYRQEQSINAKGEQISFENNDDVYWACKDKCDMKIERQVKSEGFKTGWEDIGDLIIPAHFMNWVLTVMNGIQSGKHKYSSKAYEKLKHFIIAVSQKVLREMTENERERFKALLEMNQYML